MRVNCSSREGRGHGGNAVTRENPCDVTGWVWAQGGSRQLGMTPKLFA